jgi:hypothetical protein
MYPPTRDRIEARQYNWCAAPANFNLREIPVQFVPIQPWPRLDTFPDFDHGSTCAYGMLSIP